MSTPCFPIYVLGFWLTMLISTARATAESCNSSNPVFLSHDRILSASYAQYMASRPGLIRCFEFPDVSRGILEPASKRLMKPRLITERVGQSNGRKVGDDPG